MRAASSSNLSPLTRPSPITSPSPGVRAISSCMVLRRKLPGHDHAGEFGEGIGIAQVVDILARRALARLAPLGHGLGPRGIFGVRLRA